MFKYKSKSRFNMLLYIDGAVLEIRPQEIITSNSILESKYLELLESPKVIKTKKGIEYEQPDSQP